MSLYPYCYYLSPNYCHFSRSFTTLCLPTSLSANPIHSFQNINLVSEPHFLSPLKCLKGHFKIKANNLNEDYKTLLWELWLPCTHQFNHLTLLFTPHIPAKMPFFRFLLCTFLHMLFSLPGTHCPPLFTSSFF